MKKRLLIGRWLFFHIRPHIFMLVIVIVMSSFQSLCKVGVAVLSKNLIDSAVAGLWQSVLKMGIVFVVAVVLQLLLQAGTSIMTVRTSETMTCDLQQIIYKQITRAQWQKVSKYHSGDILTRMTSDISSIVGGIMSALPETLSLCVGLIAALVALFFIDPVMLVFALALGPLAIIASYLLGSRFVMIHQNAQENEGKYRSYLQECIEQLLVIKVFSHEEESAKKLSRLQNQKIYWCLKRNYTSVITNALLTGGYWLCYLIAFGWGAYSINKGTATFGTLTAFIQLIVQIQIPIMGLAGSVPSIVSVVGSSRRLMEFEALEVEKERKEEKIDQFDQLVINQMSFEYMKNTSVLQAVTAEINQGDMIGIVGASGEGKTTLLHLIMTLLQPTRGEIFLKNKEDKVSIRSLISYVPQGNTLFSGTITYNLCIGCPNASEEEQRKALQCADAWDFVERLPEQLNSLIGEHGMGLSEGQAQRIAIARALLRKSPILILDEATAAIDIAAEQRILGSIAELEPTRTCIVVSHRSSTLIQCNRIWQLSNGILTELGCDINAALTSEEVWLARGFERRSPYY